MGPQVHTPAPPFNRWGVRLGNSVGGPYPERRAWAQAVGVETNLTRAPQNLNDGAISRERMPWVHSGYAAPPAHLVDWDAAGPARRALHMRNVTIRRMQGTSNTRAQDPISTMGGGIQDGNGSLPGGIKNLNSAGILVPTNNTPHGLHTRVRGSDVRQSTKLHFNVQYQMRPGRQNRLASSNLHGQNYSQTTAPQGRR